MGTWAPPEVGDMGSVGCAPSTDGNLGVGISGFLGPGAG